MKWIKRLGIFLCLLVILGSVSVFASESLSLQISFVHEDQPVSGAQFQIYRIAKLDETGNPELLSPFNQYPVSFSKLDESAWKSIAASLEGYILRDQLSADGIGKTDETGSLTFDSGLQKGIYLILSQPCTVENAVFESQPILVQLPYVNGEQTIHAVTIYPKYERRPLEDYEKGLTRKVLKVWEGEKSKIPASVEVSLLKDGEVYETVTLNQENDWQYTWENLDASCRWVIVEKEPVGYEVEVSREGAAYVLTNREKKTTPSPTVTPKPTPPIKDKPDLPKTGQLWWPVPVLMFAGLFFICFGLLRRRGEGHET